MCCVSMDIQYIVKFLLFSDGDINSCKQFGLNFLTPDTNKIQVYIILISICLW